MLILRTSVPISIKTLKINYLGGLGLIRIHRTHVCSSIQTHKMRIKDEHTKTQSSPPGAGPLTIKVIYCYIPRDSIRPLNKILQDWCYSHYNKKKKTEQNN